MKEKTTSTSPSSHVVLEAQSSLDMEKPHILRHHHHDPYTHGWKCHFCSAMATLKCVSCEDDFYCDSCYDRIHHKSDKSVLPFFVHHKSIPLVEEPCPDPKNTTDSMISDKLSNTSTNTHVSNYHPPHTEVSSTTHSVHSSTSSSSSSPSHPVRSTKLYPSLK